MIEGLKAYAEYQPAKCLWAHSLPVHWATTKLKHIVNERVEKGRPELPLLAATQSHGVIRKDRFGLRTVTASKDLHLLKRAAIGDFVISLRSFQGGIESVRDEGILSPAYTVLSCPLDFQPYLRYAFKCSGFVDALALSTTGIRQGQSIDYASLCRDEIPWPPLDEQRAIVRFLDYANRRIRKYIAAKRKLIALLEEQKRAIIQQAVTRGLDPNVRLKDSGVPWIGMVPEHWEIRSVRRMISFVTSGSRGWADYYADRGDIFIQSGNLGRSLELKLQSLQRVNLPTTTEGSRTLVDANDVLVCITGALTGNVAFVQSRLPEPAYVNQHVALLRPDPRAVVPRLLALALWCGFGKAQLKFSEYGGTKQGLGLDDLKSVVLPLPPRAEQQEICRYVDHTMIEVNAALAVAAHELELVHELRACLISDVVTGKLDVREVAARLPDELEGDPSEVTPLAEATDVDAPEDEDES